MGGGAIMGASMGTGITALRAARAARSACFISAGTVKNGAGVGTGHGIGTGTARITIFVVGVATAGRLAALVAGAFWPQQPLQPEFWQQPGFAWPDAVPSFALQQPSFESGALPALPVALQLSSEPPVPHFAGLAFVRAFRSF
jgi:hypothetical protein